MVGFENFEQNGIDFPLHRKMDNVACELGKVTLDGKVDIILKKDLAERIVIRVTC